MYLCTLIMKVLHQIYIFIVLLLVSLSSMAQGARGLNIVVLGDSNTSIGGDSCTLDRGWTRWFKECMQPASMHSYARSGATWTNTTATRLNTQEYTEVLADCNVVYNQVERLTLAYRQGSQPAPDVIIIAAGTNDAWFKQRRPLLFSKTAEQTFVQTAFITGRKPSAILSLAESVRYGVEMLMERFPKSRIILLTPMQTTKAPYSDVRRVGDVIEEVGRRISVPVVRQDHITGVYSNHELRKPFLTSDGTHTSVEGARRNGRLLARQIEPLLF